MGGGDRPGRPEAAHGAGSVLAASCRRPWHWRWSPAPASARRHRIQLHWDGQALGFHQRRSHQVVPVIECPAAGQGPLPGHPPPAGGPPGQDPAHQTPALGTGHGNAGRSRLRDPRVAPDLAAWSRMAGTPGKAPSCTTTGRFRLQHRAGGFYQVSPDWAAEAFGALLREWDVRGGTLYDLYGGVGFFSALLGDRFQQRCLVEFDEPAVAWARRNLEALGLAAECITADAAAWVPGAAGRSRRPAPAGPPRAGLAPELCERLQTARCRNPGAGGLRRRRLLPRREASGPGLEAGSPCGSGPVPLHPPRGVRGPAEAGRTTHRLSRLPGAQGFFASPSVMAAVCSLL